MERSALPFDIFEILSFHISFRTTGSYDDYVHDALSAIGIEERLAYDVNFLDLLNAIDFLVDTKQIIRGYVWGVPKYKIFKGNDK